MTAVLNRPELIDLPLHDPGFEPPTNEVDVARAAEKTETHLPRAENRILGLLGVQVALTAGIGGAALTTLPGLTGSTLTVAAAGTAVTFTAAAGALLAALVAFLPRLDGDFGLVAYATAQTPSAVRRAVAADRAQTADILRWTARTALTKYRRIRTSTLLTAGTVLAAAITAAATTATHLIAA